MTNVIRSEVGFMDLSEIASAMIKDRREHQNNAFRIMEDCWNSSKSCSGKVKIDGNVLFDVESKDKLQYIPYYKTIGMVYILQPGKKLLTLLSCIRVYLSLIEFLSNVCICFFNAQSKYDFYRISLDNMP